ncbi:hypothetical protein I4U23_027188 [Adineta vaga]|nr:hypothetical protein I4U23_027188 [Adineta vaga]
MIQSVHRTQYEMFNNLLMKHHLDGVQVNALVTTNYTNGLSSYSSTFMRPYGQTNNYYFHAIAVRIFSTGSYSFTSQSSFDIYGSFHNYPVDITIPSQSMIAYNDDGGDDERQFRINLNLQSNKTYVLIVSTFATNITGCFTIIVEGPSDVELIHNDHFVVESTTTTTTILPIITSTYSGILSSNNLQFARPTSNSNNYYYQAFEITAPVNGAYIFTSSSTIDTYGYFYSDSFDSLNPDLNLIASNDDGDDNRQFRINIILQFQRKYILVVTTFEYNIRGDFLIKIVGPTSLDLTPIKQIKSYYDDGFYCNSPTFSRLGLPDDHSCYFYQAIRIETSMNGTYRFFINSSMDTFTYLYKNSFNASRPFLNFIASSDDGDINQQLQISYNLQSARRYILVVTTTRENIRGTFQIIAVGSSSVYFEQILPATYYYQSLCDSCRPWHPNRSSGKRTIAIVVPILIVLIVIIIICCCCCIYRCRRKKTSEHHQNIQRSEIDVPYTIPLTRSSDHFEPHPPSYESILYFMIIILKNKYCFQKTYHFERFCMRKEYSGVDVDVDLEH